MKTTLVLSTLLFCSTTAFAEQQLDCRYNPLWRGCALQADKAAESSKANHRSSQTDDDDDEHGNGGSHPNNGHGNDKDGNDDSNPGNSNDENDHTDDDGVPGHSGECHGKNC